MAGEGSATEGPDDPFDPFSAAEHAAEQVIDLILCEGGRLLYDRYIEKKSFSFASQVISDLLVSELRMCYVRYDEGEPDPKLAAVQAALNVSGPFQRSVSEDRRASQGSTASAAVGAPAAASTAAEPAVASSALVGATAASPAAAPSPPLLDEEEDLREPLAPRESWTLESEPSRCRVDTWARACVPIRRKLVQPKGRGQEEVGRRRGGSSRGKLGSTASQGRAPSRQGGLSSTADSELKSSMQKTQQQIPLEEDREEDEEETEMRDKKDREARRRREEDARMHAKQAMEAEEVARMAQVKDQMKNKPFTYDTSGNIIWIQPPQYNKLPAANPVPNFAFKRDATPGQQLHESSPRPAPRGAAAAAKAARERGKRASQENDEYTDSFRRFASQQPSMVEAMQLAPGVGLSERGRHKNGMQVERRGGPMSRKDYEQMVTSGNRSALPPREAVKADDPSRRSPSAPPSARGASAAGESRRDEDEVSVGAVESPTAASAFGAPPSAAAVVGTAAGGPALRVVRGSDLGKELIPHAPTTPRPVQPVPPPTFRRVQMKRDALGYALSTRERVPTGTGSRFPGCAAQPPLGATMGHGLASGSQRPEEFYFPASHSLGLADDSVQEDDQLSTAGRGRTSVLGGGSARGPQGQIVKENPQLARQLFTS
mmetsp:Transcript_140533/g.356699  ORF Transcript_140533/g.356699 Transcript_140533/m.356699 type:complete len:659 (+) Transcript_140533:3-1979(+)